MNYLLSVYATDSSDGSITTDHHVLLIRALLWGNQS